MRSTSQGPRIPRFEDVLHERLNKQLDWQRKYVDMPMIDEHAKVSTLFIVKYMDVY